MTQIKVRLFRPADKKYKRFFNNIDLQNSEIDFAFPHLPNKPEKLSYFCSHCYGRHKSGAFVEIFSQDINKFHMSSDQPYSILIDGTDQSVVDAISFLELMTERRLEEVSK